MIVMILLMSVQLFLAPYEQAVDELKLKLKNLRKEFRIEHRRALIYL